MPIVEPEVTLGPGDYDIETTAFWSERVYSHVFRSARVASVNQTPGACPAETQHSLLGERIASVTLLNFFEGFATCRTLNEYNVVLDAILLKPNMVLPGELLCIRPAMSSFQHLSEPRRKQNLAKAA